MSEGELKKQITDKYELMPYDFFKNPKQVIFEILDEAKKDFPLQDNDDATGHNTGFFVASEVYRWLDKWFGDK
jgi:hypothetical protein